MRLVVEAWQHRSVLDLLSCKASLGKAMKYRFIDQEKKYSDDKNKRPPLCSLVSLLLIVFRPT